MVEGSRAGCGRTTDSGGKGPEMSVQAAIGALRHDADVWDQVSSVTKLAGQHARDLVLSETDLSWAASHTPLLGTYAEIQEKAATLLGEATTVFSGLSRALDQVAEAYQASDEEAATRLKGVWDVHG